MGKKRSNEAVATRSSRSRSPSTPSRAKVRKQNEAKKATEKIARRIIVSDKNNNATIAKKIGKGIEVTVDNGEEDLDYVDDVPDSQLESETASLMKDNEDDPEVQFKEQVVGEKTTQIATDSSLSDKAKLISWLKDPDMRTAIKDVITDIEGSNGNGDCNKNITTQQAVTVTATKDRTEDKSDDRMQMKSVVNRVERPTANTNTGRGDCTVMKSPSDTTVYVPALIHKPGNFQNRVDLNIDSNVFNRTPIVRSPVIKSPQAVNRNDVTLNKMNNDTNDVGKINQISQFIEGIRMQSSTTDRDEPQAGTSKDDEEEARRKAKQMIVDAEKYKADMVNPSGTINNIDYVSDDKFFHLSCHVDDTMKRKIEKGEFVDLEKLLPREKSGFKQNDGRLEIINKDGQTYFAKVKENRIGGVRRWEQAFRVYGAIYSAANPQRSHEIWQYVYVINSAASSYQWDNVAQYDYTFRHLMAANPTRNWGNIYLQMWNLTMRDPIQKQTSHYHGRSNDDNQAPQKKRSNYCWKFNKNVFCSDGKNCKFPHRCYFCDGYNHGKHNCQKREKRDSVKKEQGSEKKKD